MCAELQLKAAFLVLTQGITKSLFPNYVRDWLALYFSSRAVFWLKAVS